MNVQRIATMVRRKTHVNTTQYTDTELVEDLNELKDEVWSSFCSRVQADYNWEKWFATTVSWQSEYTVPEAASNLSWLKMVKWVAVNYDWAAYSNWDLVYNKATLVNPNTLWKHWNYYVENQPKETPLYFISDRSVFIAPAPVESEPWVERLEIMGLRNIVDWTISTDESEMRFPVDFQRVLVYWLMPRALTAKWADTNEIFTWENEYQKQKTSAIKEASERVETAITLEYEDDYDAYAHSNRLTLR